jgi:hypothetical protein
VFYLLIELMKYPYLKVYFYHELLKFQFVLNDQANQL